MSKNDFISIREPCPGLWVIYCPIRGIYATAFTKSRNEARKGIWNAISAPPERWLNQEQFRLAMQTLGFLASPSPGERVDVSLL
jgi:hypothetical protein